MGHPRKALRTTADRHRLRRPARRARRRAGPGRPGTGQPPPGAEAARRCAVRRHHGRRRHRTQGQRRHPGRRRRQRTYPRDRAAHQLGACRRSSTSRRPRSSPTPAMWWSVTTPAASGSPAARSRWPGRPTSPTRPRSSTGRSPTPPPTPTRIGMAGVSYGAGISLLAAAHDKRDQGRRRAQRLGRPHRLHLQRPHPAPPGRRRCSAAPATSPAGPSAELQQILEDFLGSDLAKEQEMIDWGKKRSPATYLDRINANGAAIMLGNAWGDTIFPPNQYADFYEKLTGPKRLEFRPGDHATAEVDRPARAAQRHLDQRPPLVRPLPQGRGQRRRPRAAGPAQVPLRPAATRATRTGSRWRRGHAGRSRLGGTKQIRANIDSGANGGIVLLSSILDQFVRLPPIASIPLLPRSVRRRLAVRAVRLGPADPGHREAAHHGHQHQGERHPRRLPLRRGPARPRQAGQQCAVHLPRQDARASRSPWTWSCSPPPTTSRPATVSPWSSTPSTRSTSSTTRPARS